MRALLCVIASGRLFHPPAAPAARGERVVSYPTALPHQFHEAHTRSWWPEASAPVLLLAAVLPAAVAAVAVAGRRQAIQRGLAAGALAVLPSPVFAELASKMGGLLEPYIETSKGFKLYTPTGWTKFDSDPGVYDVKFQDIIEYETTVQVATSAVSTATSIEALGTLDEVAEKIASKRAAKVMSKSTREIEGTLVYDFDLQGEKYRELQLLCINRGKLYKVTAVTSNKKWDKRKDLYKNIMLSFVPKGF